MRVPFATICLAIAAFRAGVGSYAAPSRSILKLPRYLLGVATKRHLRSDKLEIDDEERVRDFNLNEIPGEEEIVGETSKSLGTETEQLKLLKEQEQLVKPVASEGEKENKHATLLYDWNQISSVFEDEWEKAESNEFKELIYYVEKGMEKVKGTLMNSREKLLDGWEVPVDPVESESKSTTESLQAWLEKIESAEPVDNAILAYELFKVLEIHKWTKR